MSRGLIPVLGAVVFAGSVVGVASAQPAPAPSPAPAPDGAPPPAPADGAAVQPIEDAPPADIEGRDENPDAPRVGEPEVTAPVAVAAPVDAGYPIEEARRPITLPEGMSEIGIAPHVRLETPGLNGGNQVSASDTLRARYGITNRVQLGLSYLYGGLYNDPATVTSDKVGFHPGKAAGLDVTVLVTTWVGVRVGLPFYFDPFAMSLALGAPMRFIFDKFTVGGLDDVLDIKLAKFPPSLTDELANAVGAQNEVVGTQQSNGSLRLAGYGIYQLKKTTAVIGRAGIVTGLESADSSRGTGGPSSTVTFLSVGVQHTPRKFVDLGLTAGFDDLGAAGSFGVTGLLRFRI